MNSFVLLFLVSFGAATILPFYSEILLVAQLNEGLSPAWLWFSATTGNTLGAVVNWGIGTWAGSLVGSRWLPLSQQRLQRGRRWFDRYGYWTLLMSWMPVGGDAITFIGGIMRVRLSIFLVLVAIGKGARYAMIIGAFEAI